MSLSVLRQLTLFALLLASPVLAQSSAPLIVPLWPEGKMPGRGAKDPEAELPGGIPGTIHVANVSQPTLAFYPAKSASGPTPIVLVSPGGGYSRLAYTKEGVAVAEWLNSLGLSAAVLKYRVPGNREGALQDFQRAIRFIRSHAKEWKIDPARIGAIGFSAGGHLTALGSTALDSPAYPALDEIDQLSPRPDFAMLVYPAFLEKAGQLAPEFHPTKAMPPLLIVHNEDDAKFIAGTKIFDAALTAAQIPHTFLLFQTGGHGYGLTSDKDVGVWPDRAKEWLSKSGFLP